MNAKNIFLFFISCYAQVSLASDLKFEMQHFVSEPYLKIQNKDYMLLHWNQKFRKNKTFFSFQGHTQTEYNLDSSKLVYFNISELFASYSYQFQIFPYLDSIQIHLGRKIHNWSKSDEYWGLGLWNPVNLWNPLHPVPLGLIGSFLNLKAKHWAFNLLLSGVYLPNKQALITEKKGFISSSSRWFNPFPNQVNFLNLSYPNIYYLLDSPYIFNILFQPSYLWNFTLSTKKSDVKYWIRASFADKPANHLFVILKKDYILQIGSKTEDENFIHQKINIFPIRERILSGELGLKNKYFSARLTIEDTKKKQKEDHAKGWRFFDQKESFTYTSALVTYNFLPQSLITLGYIFYSWHEISNNKTPSRQTDVFEQSSFLKRYRMLNGVSVEGKTHFFSDKGLKRMLSLKYQYSFLNASAWLFFKSTYYLQKQVHSSLEINILGAKIKQNYFLYQFRHNDYASWSLTYVF